MNKQNLIIMTAAATLTLAASCTSNKEAQPENAPLVGKTEIVADHLTPELLQELGKISDMQASPDGSKVLYAVGYTSVKQDKTNSSMSLGKMPNQHRSPVQNAQNRMQCGARTDPRSTSSVTRVARCRCGR